MCINEDYAIAEEIYHDTLHHPCTDTQIHRKSVNELTDIKLLEYVNIVKHNIDPLHHIESSKNEYARHNIDHDRPIHTEDRHNTSGDSHKVVNAATSLLPTLAEGHKSLDNHPIAVGVTQNIAGHSSQNVSHLAIQVSVDGINTGYDKIIHVQKVSEYADGDQLNGMTDTNQTLAANGLKDTDIPDTLIYQSASVPVSYIGQNAQSSSNVDQQGADMAAVILNQKSTTDISIPDTQIHASFGLKSTEMREDANAINPVRAESNQGSTSVKVIDKNLSIDISANKQASSHSVQQGSSDMPPNSVAQSNPGWSALVQSNIKAIKIPKKPLNVQQVTVPP